jgi:acid phosphatase (class A)
MRRLGLVALTLTLGAAPMGLLLAQPQSAAPGAAPAPKGYLAPERVPHVDQIIPPPPPVGSPRQLEDMAVFSKTRQLEGSSRWALAKADDSYAIPYLLKAFSCAADAQLTPQNAPKTASLIQRILRDASATSASAKTVFQRKRPYLFVDGPICIEKTDRLAESPDYPSGHTTLSWATGLVLAELMPDRATQILARARAYGESRLVCGVHSVSAVIEGRATGSATVAALHGSPEFRADLEEVRTELAATRASAAKPDIDQCLVDGALTAKSPY